MEVSIRDVAKRAGVSISTVSRVMNRSARVDEEKVAAVLEAMKYYNYQPNQFGRGLVKQNSRMVGVYFQHIEGSLFDSTYNLELLKGIQKVLDYHDYSMVLIHEDEEIHKGKKFVQYVKQKKIDGLILSSISTGSEAERAYKQLLDDKYPMVYIGKRFHKDGNNVYAQYEDYIYQMIEEFYRAGHRKILIYVYEVHQGYFKDVCEKVYQHMPDIALFIEYQNGNFDLITREEMHEQIHEHVSKNKCTAIGCPHMDYMNFILGICHELEIQVPQDVSIIGVEHREMEGLTCFPPINAFYVPSREMGEASAEILIRGIESGKMTEISRELKTSYFPRESLVVRKNE